MINRQFFFSRKQIFIATAFLVVVSVFFAWKGRFIVDDAFISFRYARNFVNGFGLVWNPGESPLEGYTNFLWVLLMSIHLYFSKDPIVFSYVVGISCFIATLLVTLKLSSMLFSSRGPAFLVIILLASNPTFRSFSTSGLETMSQSLIITSIVAIMVLCLNDHYWTVRRVISLSLLASMAMLTRLDSLVILVVVGPVAFLSILHEDKSKKTKLGRILAGILPFSIIVGTWLIWKLQYYGNLLPNTYYVRVSSLYTILNGLIYVYAFLVAYMLVPMAFIGIVSLPKIIKLKNTSMLMISSLVILWCMYVIILAGGDWMEFRFMVPIIPLLFILIIWLVMVFVKNNGVRLALLLVLLIAPVNYGIPFQQSRYQAADLNSIAELHGDVQPWINIGKKLGQAFEFSNEVRIATLTAGAIPYFSRLPTIDMAGLNDKWVAKNGVLVWRATPGHQRQADLAYLIQSKVNLVVALNQIPIDTRLQSNYNFADLNGFVFFDNQEVTWMPDGATIIEIPMDNNYLLLLYLTRSQMIDQAITRNGWRVVPINNSNDGRQ
jgi:arabinofuranosyltransferase